MTSFVKSIVIDFWATVAEMSPYLLFGFLVAGILSVLISQRAVERHLGVRVQRVFGTNEMLLNPVRYKNS